MTKVEEKLIEGLKEPLSKVSTKLASFFFKLFQPQKGEKGHNKTLAAAAPVFYHHHFHINPENKQVH